MRSRSPTDVEDVCLSAIINHSLRSTSTMLSMLLFMVSAFAFEPKSVPNEVLFKPDSTKVSAQSFQQLLDADKLHPVGGAGWYLLHSRSKSSDELLKALKSRSDVFSAEKNEYFQAQSTLPNDPSFGVQWALKNTGQRVNGVRGTSGADIKAYQAWDYSTGSATISVGMLDSGLDYTHSDLGANVWSAPSSFTVTVNGTPLTCPAGSHGYNAVAGTCDPMDDYGHGTHTAGIVGAVGNNSVGVAGLNWSTALLGLKFLDSTGNGTQAQAVAAMDFALQVKAQGLIDLRAFSASFTKPTFSQIMSDEITLAQSVGVLMVAAAGNDTQNNDTTAHYPCNYAVDNVICVAATDQNDHLATFSDWGPTTVHLAAPGTNILSTWMGGGYAYDNGTSMATPLVSGTVALIASRCPSNSYSTIKSLILSNVDAKSGLSGKVITGGRLNAFRAVSLCIP